MTRSAQTNGRRLAKVNLPRLLQSRKINLSRLFQTPTGDRHAQGNGIEIDAEAASKRKAEEEADIGDAAEDITGGSSAASAGAELEAALEGTLTPQAIQRIGGAEKYRSAHGLNARAEKAMKSAKKARTQAISTAKVDLDEQADLED